MKKLNIHYESLLSFNVSKWHFGPGVFLSAILFLEGSALETVKEVAKFIAKGSKMESFKDKKLSSWMFKFFM